MFREILVIFVRADGVSVAFHLKMQRGVSQYDSGNFRQPLARPGQQLEAAALEQHV